jgi:RNA polymerase sigma-70 factor (ECF subfamily)
MVDDLSAKTTAELLTLMTSSSGPASAEAAGELVMRYRNLIYAQALAVSRHRADLAEDVFQETFLRVFGWLKKHRRQPLHSFARLLQVFSRRAALDLLRKERLTLPLIDVAGVTNFDIALYAQELLDGLDPRSAEILRLSYIEGRSAREIAEIMGLTAGNVRVLRFRGLTAIRAKQALDDYADQLEPL